MVYKAKFFLSPLEYLGSGEFNTGSVAVGQQTVYCRHHIPWKVWNCFSASLQCTQDLTVLGTSVKDINGAAGNLEGLLQLISETFVV